MDIISGLNDLAAVYSEQSYHVRKRLEDFGRELWRSMPNYRDRAIAQMVQEITPRVLAGQETLSELSTVYLMQCADLMGLDVPVSALEPEAVQAGLRGVDPYEVYERPAHNVYRALADGKPPEQAFASGELRLLQLIGGDMQIARVKAANKGVRDWQGQDGVPQYYRRILTGRENCGLCVVASTQRYKVDNLMPIHPGCDCDWGPLPKGMHPHVLDENLLEAAHGVVEERYGEADRSARSPDYMRMIVIVDHGEYGPVLQWSETLDERRERQTKPTE